MARKRHSDEDILKRLREIEVKLSAGSNVQSACRGVGVSGATYYNWCKRFGGMGRSQLSEMRSLGCLIHRPQHALRYVGWAGYLQKMAARSVTV